MQALTAGQIDALWEKRKSEILNSQAAVSVTGKVYYVSSKGSDNNSGLSPASPWKTLEKVSSAPLCEGDAVLFARGDVFRGNITVKSGVTYSAYGEGEKPRFYGWYKDLAEKGAWEMYCTEPKIWHLKDKILDCGTLVFNNGAAHSRKLIPSFNGKDFVCRDNTEKLFDIRRDMTKDLDILCLYSERLTETPSKGKSFPVPLIDNESYGELYLRCDRGDPAEVFESIEAVAGRYMFKVGSCNNVTLDNLCIKYIGGHAIAAGGSSVEGLAVTNCEIGWIGGTVQHYYGTDPNYPEGDRGSVTRYGNGVEIYGGCNGYKVENCYIYQVYDAAVTHQRTTNGKFFAMKNISYVNSLIENCTYSVEYFLEKTGGDTESYIEDCVIKGNIMRLAGFGWGNQRHNTHTPAHIKGWSFENTARGIYIEDNIFDRSTHRMLHTVAREEESLPMYKGNLYVQQKGAPFCQHGANREKEPDIIIYGDDAQTTVKELLGDREGTALFA